MAHFIWSDFSCFYIILSFLSFFFAPPLVSFSRLLFSISTQFTQLASFVFLTLPFLIWFLKFSSLILKILSSSFPFLLFPFFFALLIISFFAPNLPSFCFDSSILSTLIFYPLITFSFFLTIVFVSIRLFFVSIIFLFLRLSLYVSQAHFLFLCSFLPIFYDLIFIS